MKKILFIFISILGLYSCDNFTEQQFVLQKTPAPEITRSVGISMTEGDACLQWHANCLGNLIVNTLQTRDGGKKYPDYFGGLYTDSTGQLTVLVKGNIEEGKNAICKICNDNSIDFKQCLYSYQELSEIMSEITKKLPTLPLELRANICSYYLSDSENVVYVGLLQKTDRALNQFREMIMNHDAIRFFESKMIWNDRDLKTMVVPVWLKPGGMLSSAFHESLDVYNGSWAFRAREISDTSSCGMVTAAHVVRDSVFTPSFYGVPFSVMTDNVDAAFVTRSNPNVHLTFIPSNTLSTEFHGGSYPSYTQEVELDTALYSPIAGTTINKRGWTTGLTTGQVTSTNFCTSFIGYDGLLQVINNMTLATFVCDHGDSGGIVYTYFSNQNKRYTTGIVTGCINGVITGGFYTKASLALSTLGLERY